MRIFEGDPVKKCSVGSFWTKIKRVLIKCLNHAHSSRVKKKSVIFILVQNLACVGQMLELRAWRSNEKEKWDSHFSPKLSVVW